LEWLGDGCAFRDVLGHSMILKLLIFGVFIKIQ